MSTNQLKAIRKLLHKTQAELALALGISRALWSVHEGKPPGHDVPPHIARSLIRYARTKGVPLTYEHVYDGATLPQMVLVPVEKAPPDLRPPESPSLVRRRRAVAALTGG